jgi:hypothetical protein
MNRRHIFALCRDCVHTRKDVNCSGILEHYLAALFTRFVHILGEERGRNPDMCEHCDVLTEVLTELAGEKVAAVIMRRTEARLHGRGSEQVSDNFLVVPA